MISKKAISGMDFVKEKTNKTTDHAVATARQRL
jgi:hypothetical protein